MVTSDFRPEVEIRFRACAMKNMQYSPYLYGRIAEIFALFRKSGSRNTMLTSGFSPEVEIRPFRACAMHPAIITLTVRSLLTWLWGRYHVPQNAFLVLNSFIKNLLMTKSKACKLDLVKGQASRPYKRTGRHLLLIKCRVTSSEAQRRL